MTTVQVLGGKAIWPPAPPSTGGTPSVVSYHFVTVDAPVLAMDRLDPNARNPWSVDPNQTVSMR